MRKLHLTVWLLACWAGLVFAAENESQIPFTPPEDKSDPSKVFPDIQAEARRIDKIVRQHVLLPPKDWFPQDDLARFGSWVNRDVNRILTENAPGKRLDERFPHLEGQLKYFEDVLAVADQPRDRLPAFSVTSNVLAGSDTLYAFLGNTVNQGQLSPAESARVIAVNTTPAMNVSKEDALVSLQDAIYPYQRTLNSYTAYQTRMKLVELSDEWDRYFDSGRPQTFWDIAVTTLVEYRGLSKKFLARPPARQWFVLHPNVVIENLKAAPDGSELRGALALEWIGVNWWRGFGPVKIPFGVSFTSLYSDRARVPDVGHGVSLYFANKYCIGWADHGGHHGFFVSLDALKLIDSKRAKIDQYRGQVEKIFGAN